MDNSMQFQEYQTQAGYFNKDIPLLPTDLSLYDYWILRLVADFGELTKLITNQISESKIPKKENVKCKLGNILYSVSILSYHLNIKLVDIANFMSFGDTIKLSFQDYILLEINRPEISNGKCAQMVIINIGKLSVSIKESIKLGSSNSKDINYRFLPYLAQIIDLLFIFCQNHNIAFNVLAVSDITRRQQQF